MSENSVVDESRLDSLYKILTDRLGPILDSFERSASSNLGLLRESMVSGDREVFQRAAHSIKGSAANYSAIRLQTLCAELEADSEEAIPGDASERVDILAREAEQVVGAIRVWRAAKGMAPAE
ncbi:MAG: Hpt domain-containing protein [Gammaproteobacteria bacterium]